MRSRARAAPAAAMLLLTLFPLAPRPAAAAQPTRAGVTVPVGRGDGTAYRAGISRAGDHVVFVSAVADLVAGDDNAATDVFVWERRTGAIDVVSISTAGELGDDHSYQPSITPDGRFVSFTSRATNLVPDDYNGHQDVFVRDRLLGTTTRVSVSSTGRESNGGSGSGESIHVPSVLPAISDDGSRVVFWSDGFTLVPGDTNFTRDVFARDLAAGSTARVSVSSQGTQGLFSSDASISPDGRFVAFATTSAFTSGDTNSRLDVYLRDLEAGTTERVSMPSTGAQPTDSSYAPTVTAGGRYVAFSSESSNLVPDGPFAPVDVYVRDRDTGVERVSVGSDAQAPMRLSWGGPITSDGRYVPFTSLDDTLSPTDANGTYDVFVHDRLDGTTERLSSVGSAAPAGSSRYPSVDDAGRFAAFTSEAENLDPSDGNGEPDVFLRDRGPQLGFGQFELRRNGDDIRLDTWAAASGVRLLRGEAPAGDGTVGGVDVGADLVAAELVYRPESHDLIARIDVRALTPMGSLGNRSIVWGLRFEIGGVTYDARAERNGLTREPPTAGQGFALYRCADACSQVVALPGGIGTLGHRVQMSIPFELYRCATGSCTFATSLAGGFGTAGEDVSVSVPAAAIGGVEGTPLDDVRAFARPAAGDLDADAAVLGTVTIPAVSVDFGAAPAGADASAVAFDHPGTIAGGAVSASFDAVLPPGIAVEVWARTCVGSVCHAAAFATG